MKQNVVNVGGKSLPVPNAMISKCCEFFDGFTLKLGNILIAIAIGLQKSYFDKHSEEKYTTQQQWCDNCNEDESTKGESGYPGKYGRTNLAPKCEKLWECRCFKCINDRVKKGSSAWSSMGDGGMLPEERAGLTCIRDGYCKKENSSDIYAWDLYKKHKGKGLGW